MIEQTNLGQQAFFFDLTIGDRVRIDDDPQHGFVTAILVRDRGAQYEVSWMNNGTAASGWFETWRVAPVETSAVGFAGGK